MLRTVICLSALVLVLSACPSDEPPAPSVALDPCALIEPGEAARVTGWNQPGDPQTLEDTGELCSFDGPEGRVIVVVYGQPLSAEELRDEDAPGEVIDGIGDAAYYYQLTGDLKVVVDGAMFHVGAFEGSQPAREDTEALARVAASRA